MSDEFNKRIEFEIIGIVYTQYSNYLKNLFEFIK